MSEVVENYASNMCNVTEVYAKNLRKVIGI